eukprot:COSAG03_NODE_6781_length_1006_cov_8.192944_3_plen_84_part_00
MITRVPVSAAERTAGKLSPGHLAAALAALRADGIVALGDAIDPRVIDGLREVPPQLSKSKFVPFLRSSQSQQIQISLVNPVGG